MMLKKTGIGWKETHSASGVTFFMGWDRLEKALGPDRPAIPEIGANEKISTIETSEHGIQFYVVTNEEYEKLTDNEYSRRPPVT